MRCYLLAALKQDYQLNQKKPAKISPKPTETPYLRETKEAIEIVPLRNKYMSYKLKMYIKFIQQQAESIQVTIKETFEHHLKPNVEVFRFYKRSGLTSPFVMTSFFAFIDKQFPHVLGNYLNFDDYITSEEG